jgi:nucleoside-diphosphate-sugar epimerase
VLIVGCGCRGRTLGRALLEDGHAVRGTTRGPIEPLVSDGIEAHVADPDRLGTAMAALPGVSVVCWLLATATGANAAELNGARLSTLLERLVDTPVRGFVYEAGGGEEAVLAASERWRIAVRVVSADPARHDEWLAAMRSAVNELL